MTKLTNRLAAILVLLGTTSSSAWTHELRVLIVDGQNNHNWKATTPVLEAILESSGHFEVDVATSPSRGKDLSGFRPDFKRYDAVLLNYNGKLWPEETRRDFEDYVAGGGGVGVVHAANNSFPGWKEYNQIIGLGGWGGRNEKSGPYLRLRDGKFVPDESKGRGGSHGKQHAYVIETRAPDHPIMKGLPRRWMHPRDELYDRLRGPAKNVTVLASAFSSKESGGSGEHEPVLMTIRYGKGRVFHTVLGHSPYAMKGVGFIVTLRRGTEWAATGKVTLTEVPPDFPTEEEPTRREELEVSSEG